MRSVLVVPEGGVEEVWTNDDQSRETLARVLGAVKKKEKKNDCGEPSQILFLGLLGSTVLGFLNYPLQSKVINVGWVCTGSSRQHRTPAKTTETGTGTLGKEKGARRSLLSTSLSRRTRTALEVKVW